MRNLFRRLGQTAMIFVTLLLMSATLGAVLIPNPNVYLPVQVAEVLFWGLMTFLCGVKVFSWKDKPDV